MTTFATELAAAADAAIDTMRVAATRARATHAEAELMRHMLTTTQKVSHRPRHEAVETVVGEWLAAWYLTRADWPALAGHMDGVTEAFYDYVLAPDAAADAELRTRWHALDDALRHEGTTLADQMAWRSQCAHGWWDVVSPAPADLPGRKPRPIVPVRADDQPFWTAGCADLCR